MSTENKAHNRINATKFVAESCHCVHSIGPETFTISADCVFTMGFFRQALGFLCPPTGFYSQRAGIHFFPFLPLGFHRA
jgi:hypothetical protein